MSAGKGRLVPVLIGATAATVLLAFYLGLITALEGRAAAQDRFADDAPYFAFLLPGFGLQIGLFARLRGLRCKMKRTGAVAGANAGVSTTAMLACCAHFVPTALPIVGVSAASAFLTAWQAPLLIVAIVLNLGGAAYMFRTVRRVQASIPTGLVDPICGMSVEPPYEHMTEDGGQIVAFCSATCQETYLARTPPAMPEGASA